MNCYLCHAVNCYLCFHNHTATWNATILYNTAHRLFFHHLNVCFFRSLHFSILSGLAKFIAHTCFCAFSALAFFAVGYFWFPPVDESKNKTAEKYETALVTSHNILQITKKVKIILYQSKRSYGQRKVCIRL